MTQESILKKRIKDVLDFEGIFWSAVKGGPHSKPGDPDIIACIDGRFVGIEAKTPTGKVSDIQLLRGRQIVDSGGCFYVIRSEDELWRMILEVREGSPKFSKKRFSLTFYTVPRTKTIFNNTRY